MRPTSKSPARILAQKKLQYEKQQESINSLSIPAERVQLHQREEYISKALYGNKKANQGMHLVAEHPVITRDMRISTVKRNKHRKRDQERAPQGWDIIDEEASLPSIIAHTNAKHLNETGSVRGKKVIKTSISNSKSPKSDHRSQMVWQGHAQVDITNYQQHKLILQKQIKEKTQSDRDKAFKMIQNQTHSRRRKHFYNSHNRDLEVNSKDQNNRYRVSHNDSHGFNSVSSNRKELLQSTDSLRINSSKIRHENFKSPETINKEGYSTLKLNQSSRKQIKKTRSVINSKSPVIDSKNKNSRTRLHVID